MQAVADFPRSISVMLRESELEIHRDYIHAKLSTALPQTQIQFVSSADQISKADGIDALITPVQPWVDDVVAIAPNLRWIHFLSAGVDGIWNLAFDKKKYILTKSSGVHSIPMAEYAIGGILYFLKGFHVFSRQQQNREWKRFWLDEASRKTVAVLGLGAIGKEIAKRCKQMGMTVYGMATSVRPVDHVDTVCDPADLKDILRKADFVVVCLPLTADTRGLLDRETLETVKPGAYFVDISRGGIVDQGAFVDLLQTGRLAGALLDVFETEPLPEDSPLWGLDNVLVTPHVSGTTPRYMERAIDIFLENHGALVAGSELLTPVDVRTGY